MNTKLNGELAEYQRGYIAGKVAAVCGIPNELPLGVDAWRAGWADGWAETWWEEMCPTDGNDDYR